MSNKTSNLLMVLFLLARLGDVDTLIRKRKARDTTLKLHDFGVKNTIFAIIAEFHVIEFGIPFARTRYCARILRHQTINSSNTWDSFSP